MTPVVVQHQGISVVRDDMFPGGTKARYLPALFDGANELVYASPAEGGAQTALAQCAADCGKQATIFVAKRADPHLRTLMAKRLGAKVMQVSPGYLSVVQARARAYCAATGAALVPFGADTPQATVMIAAAAKATGLEPEEVWCAAGSGVSMRGLAAAWPNAKRIAVQIGRPLRAAEVAGAEIVVHHLTFGDVCRTRSPFPSDPHYDAKAWEICQARHGAGQVVFWNVTGPPEMK